jgi:hypothetical protein
MPPGSGGQGSYGRRHTTQEEIYYVISGQLQFKLGDDIVEVICSVRLDDPRADAEIVDGFWPE